MQEAPSSFTAGWMGSWEPQEWAGPPQASNLVVMGAHGGLHFKSTAESEETLLHVLEEGESQLTMQAYVLKLQSERLLEVCHGKGAHGVNLCHLTWDLFCLILDNYSTDIFIWASCLTLYSQGEIGAPRA